MKKMMSILIVMSIAFLLNGCLTSSDREVKDVKISKASDLYGVWKWDDTGEMPNLMNSYESKHFIVLGEESFFVSYSEHDDDTKTFQVIPMKWALKADSTLQFYPNVKKESVMTNCRISSQFVEYGGDIGRARIFKYSDADSIVRGLNQLEVKGFDTYADDGVTDSSASVVIQLNASGDQKEMHLVDESCYKENQDAANLTGLCEVSKYKLDTGFEIKKLVEEANVESSTDCLKYMYEAHDYAWPGAAVEE